MNSQLTKVGACGVPVIGGRSRGEPDAIAHSETGLLVDGNSPQVVAEAVIHLLTRPKIARLGPARGTALRLPGPDVGPFRGQDSRPAERLLPKKLQTITLILRRTGAIVSRKPREGQWSGLCFCLQSPKMSLPAILRMLM
jgi:hypothetical protein